MSYSKEKQFENAELGAPVSEDNDLKSFIVQYVGEKAEPSDGMVTLQMVIDVLADDFPSVVFALAEENYLRGYEQGLGDAQTGWLAHQEEKKNAT